MNQTSRLHDDAVVELLREDPSFADEYLAAALDESDQSGGREALLAALRHVAEAQGMAVVAERAAYPQKACIGRYRPVAIPPSRRCWPCLVLRV